MEVVLDSNVFFRILISQGDILSIVFNESLLIFGPETLLKEFNNHKKELMRKSSLSAKAFNELAFLVFDIITFVPKREYISFIPKAKTLLGSHLKDVEFVALSLCKNCKIWTYENLLFDIGVGISTKQLCKELGKESK
ncbi:MAG: PIN domain-containing protein [Euryarchaeota archaeon]|nr:PIN domain-containing protein [Euryarchaeota archaeon]